jgi:hypothetical protein
MKQLITILEGVFDNNDFVDDYLRIKDGIVADFEKLAKTVKKKDAVYYECANHVVMSALMRLPSILDHFDYNQRIVVLLGIAHSQSKWMCTNTDDIADDMDSWEEREYVKRPSLGKGWLSDVDCEWEKDEVIVAAASNPKHYAWYSSRGIYAWYDDSDYSAGLESRELLKGSTKWIDEICKIYAKHGVEIKDSAIKYITRGFE